MTEPAVATGTKQGEPPVTGWKAIAARLDVSERTAQRWAERYGLPVHRHSRGGRPLVFAYAAELEMWRESEEAVRAAGDRAADVEDGRTCAASAGRGAEGVASGDGVAGGSALAGSAERPTGLVRRWRTVVICLISSAALMTCGAVVWLRAGSFAGRGLSEREAGRARGSVLSHDRVQLDVRVEGRSPSMATIPPGEMLRIEVPGLRLGVQARAQGQLLRAIVHRLEGLREGESARYLLTRDLAKGQTERFVVEGVTIDLTWRGSSAAPGAAKSADPPKPCCVTCDGITVCSEAVASHCGQCAGQAGSGSR